jgi:hypothetical protein
MRVLASALEFADEDTSETTNSIIEHTDPQDLTPEHDETIVCTGVLCDFMATAQARIDAIAVREQEGTILQLAA